MRNPESDIDLLIVRDDPDRPLERRLKVRCPLRDIIREVPISPLVHAPEKSMPASRKGMRFCTKSSRRGRFSMSGSERVCGEWCKR